MSRDVNSGRVKMPRVPRPVHHGATARTARALKGDEVIKGEVHKKGGGIN
jgi:hypothetical protein